MRKALVWIGVAVGVTLFWFFFVPRIDDEAFSGGIASAMNEARQVSLAAKLYSEDHQGRLPASLTELSPTYLPDGKLYAKMHLAMPNAVLEELSPETIIAFKLVRDPRREETHVIIAYADGSIAAKK